MQDSKRAAFANTGKTSDELRSAIAGWRQPHTAGPLSPEQLEAYYRDGFLVMLDVLDQGTLQRAQDALENITDSVAQKLFQAGEISDAAADSPFERRLCDIESQWKNVNVLVHKHGELPHGVVQLWTHPVLLGAAKQILGPELSAHPVWNIRSKTPDKLSDGQATVPWHQDNAYLSEESWTCLQLTAWVPLVDAHAENGCMQVVRGSHASGRTAPHTCCVGGTWYVNMDPRDMESALGVDVKRDTVTLPMRRGSVLLLNNLIAHRSTPNRSQGVRWSLDLRFQRTGEPNGFYGLKDNLPIASAEDPNLQADWETWGSLDRQQEQTAPAEGFAAAPDLDTIIYGPWMGRWPLTNENRHTDAWKLAGAVGTDGARFL